MEVIKYTVIPAKVRYNPNLRDKAKLLYGEILMLCKKSEDGYCWATNEYFAKLYGVSRSTISSLIKELVEEHYIGSQIIYRENSKEVLGRRLNLIFVSTRNEE